MAPFRNAVSFVNSNPSKLLLLIYNGQVLPNVIESTRFRGNVKKPGQWVACCKVPEDALFFRRQCCAVYTRSFNICGLQRIYLVILLCNR